MWEPFTERARHAVVRAQEVAQMFASNYIGNEHIAFALAEGDDELGRLLTNAIDREQLRDLLGGARRFPNTEMVFTPGAKRTIELAFENARRLGQAFIGAPHLALGILGSEDRIPILPETDIAALRAEITAVAAAETNDPHPSAWEQTAGGNDAPPAAGPLLLSLHYDRRTPPGAVVSLTIEPPDGAARTWTWKHVGGTGRG
ncbi:MAG TPA: Clp protease N-terminal domain-containing protein [Candidatus Elarobacter sp.]|jgi:ATP-dependent Clp protease ATP-binding subunit ClpC|nr:Clp protease N-terminal domain-containing protein [Candidatus Elarobacter sp.]